MFKRNFFSGALALVIAFWGLAAHAAPPVASTVPVDPQDPIQPHDIISGKPTTLKGAVDAASVGATWTWDPGDGSPSVSGTVNPAATSITQMDDPGFTPHYAIWIEHTYTGTDGDVFLATLTVSNAAGESDSAVYRMRVRNETITTEVNVSIDEALWFMHRNFFRFDGAPTQANGSTTAGAVPMGKWDFVQTGGLAQGSSTAAAVNAFEANGYLPNGPDSSPYTETVSRGLTYVLASLGSQGITPQTRARPAGEADDPDVNGNGIGVYLIGTDPPYQGGMVMDAIIASGTPDAVATVGRADIVGRTYGDIIQDMVDYYAFAQSDNTAHGGWRYGAWNNSGGTHDNSTGGWAAIGLVAAEDIFGATVPEWVKERNRVGLEFTDFESDTDDYICCGNDRGDGTHGYTATGPIWGPFSTTSAAMVQMTMDDIESTTSTTPDERWIRSENFFRRHFNSPVTGNTFKNYYYAMFNFAKAMRTAVPEEVVLIGTDNSVGCGPGGGTPGCSDEVAALDWYLDPADGLARTVVDYQVTTGVNIGMFSDRSGNSHGSRQDEYNTSWATQILTRTLFQAGPVARASATPNPGASNSPILLDGSESFHQDPARSLVSYEWDFDNDGTFDATGVTVTTSFDCPTLPVPCDFPVRLRVRDNNVPARFDDDVVVVEITIPPRPPTADAGGPYLACAAEEFALDGSGSADVDEGTSETGEPPFDTITSYNWELDGVSPFDFDEASGVSPLVSFPVPDTRDIGLQVADNTALAFPTAGQPNLTDRDFTSVEVGDCSCIGPVSARTKPGKAQLVWNPVAGAASYDILRSVQGSAERFDTVAVDHVTDYATYLDRGLTNGTTYWYRVIPKGADGMPICAFSRAVAATPQESRRSRTEFVQVPDVVGLDQSAAETALLNEGLAVGDISFANDPVIPEGAVSASVPSAGNSVAEGSAVDLVVSLGPERVPVPDIVGETQADAEALIVGAGLAVGTITTGNSDTVPEGSVISQDPPGGVEVVLGSEVNFVVSLGPVTAAVPNVVGSSQADGEAAIAAAGLAVGAITTENSDTVPSGDIISQNPAAGTEVVLGTAVDLVVSLGPVTVAVPDVIGLPQADAEAAILAADLAVGSIATQNSAAVPAGNVINQSPGAGSNVVPGVSVNLVVSLGPVQVIVPDVIGFAQADAEAALVGADLGAGTVTEENSLTVPAGNVISQDPAPGTEVDESSLVALVVSIGPRQVTVPNVVGQTQANAEAAIVAADLVVGSVGTDTSATVPAGDVISQSPVGGTTVDEQSAVNLVVSSGPAQVTVPGVVGLTQADAESAIVAAQLQVGAVTTANSATVPAGSVISQNPAAGTTVDEQSSVDLLVSLGPVQVDVPTVVGLAQADAESAILAAGLTVGTVGSENSETVAAGEVISQNPAGGTTVDEGSAVDIVVSLGAPDIEVPNVVGLAQAVAESTLTGAGLTVGTVSTEPSFAVAEGDVISQSPVGGSFAEAGSAVNLVVSEGAPPDDEAPSLGAALDQDPPIYDQGQSVLLSITASDNSGIVDVTFSLDGGAAQPATLPTTTIDTTGFAEGSTHTILVTATDPAANSTSETLTFAIRDPNDATPPVASLNSPADLAEVDFITPIVGTASDAGLIRYQLLLRRAGDDPSAFRVISEGNSSVTNGSLGQLDPTLLEDGLYVVRLVAEDAAGLSAAAERTYAVSSEAKPGILKIGFVDLAIPVTGVPIAVERNYDSRRKVSGDFGYGWNLQIRQGSFESNRPPGDGWQVVSGGGFFNLPCQSVVETKNHLTEVRLSDREWFQFKLRVTSNGALFGGCDVTVGFDFVDGSTPGATLQILDGTGGLYQNGTDQIVDLNFETIDPERVRLRTIDGRVYDFDANFGGITRLQDPNGNVLSIGTNGVTHSSGKGISFTRDGQGRITQITDPAGNTLQYAYDAAGDLVSFVDQAGNETTFEYDARHNLLVINDPLGNRANRNEYDDDGRLIAVVDANGNRVEFTHNVAGREEVITDARGAVTRLLYDEDGNITSRERTVTIEGAPVVVTESFAYDADGNETLVVDGDGVTTEASYNSLDLPTTRTVDPGGLGITSNFAYNASGDLLNDVDPNGLVQEFAYDGSGNPTTWEDRDGFTVNLTYDADGNLIGTSDAAGNSRSVSYDDDGFATEVIDVLGNRKSFTYDANGNRTSETVFRTIGGTLTGLTTSYQYDALGNVTRITDPDGNVTQFEYNVLGKKSARVDPLGRRTEYQYDAVGALIRTTYPDGTTESIDYDAAGNVIARTDRAGRITTFEYDELNRLVRTVNPDGTDSRTVYTPGGREAARIDENGNRTEFEYDAAGRLVLTRLPAVVDATSGGLVTPEIRYEYDPGGRRTAIIDAAGNRTEFSYDVPGRTVTVTNPDGTQRTTGFDQFGRTIFVTDEEGRRTEFAYEGEGEDRLVSVRLPSPDGIALGPLTEYTYDEVGNRLTQTDALGRVTTFEYDALNRPVRQTLPDGDTRSLAYDAVGNLISRTTYAGDVTSFQYDLMNRLSRKDLPDGDFVTYGYTANDLRQQVVDARGTTTYAYDLRDRVTSVTNAAGEEISYSYDPAGNLTSIGTPNGLVEYDYDAQGRLLSLTTDGETIQYGYDVNGRLATVDTPNGIQATYTYDSRDRTTSLVYRNTVGSIVESYAYQYSPSSLMTRMTEADGSTTDYTYDGIGRLIAEQRAGTLGYTHSYEYDAVGNRTKAVIDGVTINYTYDANDQLLSDGTTTYTYDADGNLIERDGPGGIVAYGWTPENRLASVEKGGQLTTFGYDADGNRVSRQTSLGLTRFLVDQRNPTGYAQVLEETDGTGNLISDYQYGKGPAMAEIGGNRVFYHPDAGASTRLLTDAAGAVAEDYTYSAYGELVGGGTNVDQPYRYRGEQFEEAADSYYLRARYYDPSIGRFLSRDPFLGVPEIPTSLNPYLYGNSNPVSYYDPSGNFSLISVSFANVISSGIRGINTAFRATTLCRLKSRLKVMRFIWELKSAVAFAKAFSPWANPLLNNSIDLNTGGVAQKYKFLDFEAKPPPALSKGDPKKAEGSIAYKSSGDIEVELAGQVEGSQAVKLKGSYNPISGAWSLGGEIEEEVEVGKLKYCGVITYGEVKIALALEAAATGGPGKAVASGAGIKGQFKVDTLGLAELQFTVFTLTSGGGFTWGAQ